MFIDDKYASPCPFCESDNLFVDGVHSKWKGWYQWVECHECGSRGPKSNEPIDAWNKAKRRG